jgi:hypothetical protein
MNNENDIFECSNRSNWTRETKIAEMTIKYKREAQISK